jgi:hypothetical protein
MDKRKRSYSVDKIKLKSENITRYTFEGFLKIAVIDPRMEFKQNFGFSEYRYQINIEDYNGDGEKCSFACFYRHNMKNISGSNYRADFVLEFNPNKCEGSEILTTIFKRFFIHAINKVEVMRLDVAVDLYGVNIGDLGYDRNGKSIVKDMKWSSIPDDRTLYFGKGNGAVKVYNKAREIADNGVQLTINKLKRDTKKIEEDLKALYEGRDKGSEEWANKAQEQIDELEPEWSSSVEMLKTLEKGKKQFLEETTWTRYEVSLEVKKVFYELKNHEAVPIKGEFPELFYTNIDYEGENITGTDRYILAAITQLGMPLDGLPRGKREKLKPLIKEKNDISISKERVQKTIVNYVDKLKRHFEDLGGTLEEQIIDYTITDEDFEEFLNANLQAYRTWEKYKKNIGIKDEELADSKSMTPKEKENIQNHMRKHFEEET